MKNIWDFTIKIFFLKKSKVGHGGPTICPTQNRILRRTTVTDFSKTFLVFYKLPDLTDVQGILATQAVRVLNFSTFSHFPGSWALRWLRNKAVHSMTLYRYRPIGYSKCIICHASRTVLL